MANKTSKSNEAYFSKYKSSGLEAKNRLKRLERQLKQQPNNSEAIQQAIKAGPGAHRKTPVTPRWSHQAIEAVKLEQWFKALVGNTKVPEVPKNYSFFSLGTRAKVVQW